MMRSILTATALLLAVSAQAEVRITDDLGREVVLREPADRLVSLAPHLTEQVFAAGAGDALVAVSAYSDYPEEARRLPEVGDAFRVDLERLVQLAPDVVLAWDSGTPDAAVARMREMGLRVAVFRPRSLEDIPRHMQLIGKLTGREEGAARAAEAFMQRLAVLQAKYSGRRPVRVFYEISSRPLYTVNGEHTISAVIELCGGRNVFADLDALAPSVSVEAVLARDPEAIIGSGEGEAAAQEMLRWLRWRELAAARYTNLFLVPPELIARASPRILEGAEIICEDLEEARGRLPTRGKTTEDTEDTEE